MREKQRKKDSHTAHRQTDINPEYRSHSGRGGEKRERERGERKNKKRKD